MIINFEEITHELTEEEKGIIPLLVKGLEQHNPSNPIKEPDLVHVLNQVSKVRMTGGPVAEVCELYPFQWPSSLDCDFQRILCVL